jgi:hypothetical protein
VYQNYASQRELLDRPPQQQIDVVAIESQLRAMANAERQFFATRGAYASLEQLESDGFLSGRREHRGYRFSAEVDGDRGFTILAEPIDPAKEDWPVLSIDQSMHITRE